jgi:hypothetical protein
MNLRRALGAAIVGGTVAAAIGIGGAVLPSLAAPGDERGAFEPLAPTRILDTRDGTGAPVGPLGAGATINVQVTGVGGVPANATGVVLNATIDGPTQDTFVSVYPTGAAQPNSSTINANTGDRLANMVTLKVGVGGQVTAFNFAGQAHLIFDVAGYFVDRDFVTAAELVDAKPAVVHVAQDGTLVSGPAGVTVEKSNFVYSVFLPGDWTDCSVAGSAPGTPASLRRSIAVSLFSHNEVQGTTQVAVRVIDLTDGADLEGRFNLQIACP